MTTDTVVTAQVEQSTPEPSTPVEEVKVTEAPEGEAETAEGAKPELTDAEKQQAAFDKRIARQTAANRESQRQLQEARNKIAEYEAKLAAAKPDPLADKPNQDQYETLEEFIDALADWKVAQKDKEKADKAKEPNVDEIVAQKLEMQKHEIAFKAKEAEFSKSVPEYEKSTQVVNGLLKHVDPKHPSTQAFSSGLLNAPNPPAVIHYLGTHPDVAIAMMTMEPFEIQDKMAEIIESIDAPKQKVPAENLPAPPTPLTGKTRPSKSLDDMSGAELLSKFMPKGR